MTAAWLKAFEAALKKAAADFRPEALILHHLWILSSLALDIFPKAKSIGVCHHTDLRQARQNPALKEKHVKNIGRLNRIASLSPGHEAEIRRVYPGYTGPVMALGGGYDGGLFFPATKIRSGPVKILYAGKIDLSKGVFALIEAFSALRREDDEVSLTVVGSPPEEHAAELKRLAAAIPGLSLSPALPQKDLARIMRAHDVFALPSFFEGLGLIAVEALASGLWVVATEIEGLMSLLGPRVLESGVIELIPRPGREHPGLMEKAELEAFTLALKNKLARQVGRARDHGVFPQWLGEEIARHSWPKIAARINGEIAAM